MDRYRISNLSLNSTLPPANVHLSNTRPLYTMCGSQSHYNHQQQQLQRGPQLFMNTPTVGTSTTFQFVPAAKFSTAKTSSTTIPLNMGIGISIAPFFNSVKTFFVNLMKPKVHAETNNVSSHDTTARQECNPAPNIMGIMSDRKCNEFDKKSLANLSNYEVLSKLSASTKSFSEYDLPVTTNKNNFIPKTQEITRQIELNCLEQPALKATKENEENSLMSVPIDLIESPPFLIPFQQKAKKNRKRNKMSILSTRKQCSDSKSKRVIGTVCNVNKEEKAKKNIKNGKNKNRKQKQELAQTIYEDVETENHTMSTDEWDEPIVFVSTLKKNQINRLDTANKKLVCFSKEDFPAMPAPNASTDSTNKQILEFPTTSYCLKTSFNTEKQRQISECDSEDSFIVFENDDKSIPSSMESTPSICERIRNTLSGQRWQQQHQRQRQISENSDDDFICFEIEESDIDNNTDDEEYNPIPSESDSESEIDNIISSGTNPPDSGFEEKKVRFNLKPEVHILRAWSFAYHKARKGEWEQFGRDRVRFHDRIKRLESTLVPILNSDHRQKIYNERFHSNADHVSCDGAIGN